MAPIPVSRYLVPQAPLQAPDGFTSVNEKILDGLPHTIALDRATELVVAMPNGVALTWRDADPAALVSRSAEELSPYTPNPAEPVASVGRAPLRLLVRLNGALAFSIPLRAGQRRIASDSGDAVKGSQIEVYVLSWEIYAGSLRGPGDFGSRISFAWRHSNQAVNHFSDPPPHPYLLPRLILVLPERFRIESTLGLREFFPLGRFQNKKVILR
ncbi:MAG TPA: hypothetical protein VFN26_06085 [Candidatus Acidoferrum sp.]|nr:hypothetical protein [Candidatus Acidoferrum sp.]